PEQFIVIVPFIKVEILIHSHEKIKFILGVLFRKVGSGVVSVADTLLFQLKSIDFHEFISICSPVQHFQTMCISCRGGFFKRGLPCRHENDPVQAKGDLRFHHCMDMPDMDRIKSPAKNYYLHENSILPAFCDCLYRMIVLPMIVTIWLSVASLISFAISSLSSRQFCSTEIFISSLFSRTSLICSVKFSLTPFFPT